MAVLIEQNQPGHTAGTGGAQNRTACDDPIARARELLRTVLPEPLWLNFLQGETVQVIGARGLYIISPHAMTEIRQPSTGVLIGRACLQLSIPAPSYDRIVTEYLLLTNAEDLYWKTANIFESAIDVRIALLVILDFALLLHLLIQTMMLFN